MNNEKEQVLPIGTVTGNDKLSGSVAKLSKKSILV